MLIPFDWILIMCAAAGLAMVIGSIVLLNNGAIQLSENTGHALEAEFKNQWKISVRNPALALFVIGFAFFWLALYVGKPENELLVISGHVNIADVNGLTVRLQADNPISVTSEGDFSITIQPSFQVKINAPPGYTPHDWSQTIKAEEVRQKHGHIEIYPTKEFKLASGTAPAEPQLNIQSQSIPIFKSRSAAH
jgi:hypothetical protein